MFVFMFDLKFRGKLIAGLTAACFVLILVAALTYSALAHNTVDRQWVTHTLLVLERLSDLQSRIADAETGQRGFLLTGDKTHLEAYENSLTEIPASLHAIRELTSDNPLQQRNLDGLDARVNARLTDLRAGIEIRNRGGFAASAAAVSTTTGKLRTDEIRSGISIMKAEEHRLLLLRTAELDFSTRRAKLFIIFGEALGFCFLLLAGVVIQQEMSKRRRGEEEIRSLNADLERRVAERTAELSARSKDLERSNLELQQFAYVASHDLQEPLRTISSFTQLLAKRYRSKLDDKACEFIDFAVDGCKRMQALINDLLAFSRVGTQAQRLQPVRCDAVLDRVLKSLRVAIQESGTEIQREPLPVVMADEGQLAQLFQNLIANAIKFRSEQPPRIHVSAERKDAAWTISVRDNGIGIAPEHSDRVFVIFQRLHTKTQYAGTGIGLAVCKKIAERHGGRLWVQPAPQGGSIFSFTITAGEISHASSTEEQTHRELRINAAAH
jgi:signal transduction histidine kinase